MTTFDFRSYGVEGYRRPKTCLYVLATSFWRESSSIRPQASTIRETTCGGILSKGMDWSLRWRATTRAKSSSLSREVSMWRRLARLREWKRVRRGFRASYSAFSSAAFALNTSISSAVIGVKLLQSSELEEGSWWGRDSIGMSS